MWAHSIVGWNTRTVPSFPVVHCKIWQRIIVFLRPEVLLRGGTKAVKQNRKDFFFGGLEFPLWGTFEIRKPTAFFHFE